MIELPTLVCNISTSPQLVALAKREGRFVLIDRTTIWGNLYSHLPQSTARWKVATRDEAIARYDAWLDTQPELLAKLPLLVGKLLGCHCLPKPCHGLVLARRAERLRAVA